MNLLTEVERFIRARDMKVTRFGRAALNDPRLVQDMRDGRALQPRTTKRVQAFMTAYAGSDD